MALPAHHPRPDDERRQEALPARTQDGIVQVSATHTFRFNPLFQSSLAGVAHISFMRQITVLTTTVRVFVE